MPRYSEARGVMLLTVEECIEATGARLRTLRRGVSRGEVYAEAHFVKREGRLGAVRTLFIDPSTLRSRPYAKSLGVPHDSQKVSECHSRSANLSRSANSADGTLEAANLAEKSRSANVSECHSSSPHPDRIIIHPDSPHRRDKGTYRFPQGTYDAALAGFLSSTPKTSVPQVYETLLSTMYDAILHTEGKRAGTPISLSTLRRIKKDFERDPVLKLAFYDQEARKEYMRTYRGKVVSSHANDMWQIDMTRCDIEVVDPEKDWGFYRPRVQSVIDVFSGCIMGVSFSVREDQPQADIALYYALTPKNPPYDQKYPMYGTPKRIYVDNGLVYGKHFERVCTDLGIEVIHSPPYKSWVRGKKERFYGSLHGLEKTLPGYTGENAVNRDSEGLVKLRAATTRWQETGKDPGWHNRLLTLDEYQSMVAAWLISRYHTKVIDGKSRLQHFLDTAPPQSLAIHNNEELLMVVGQRLTRTVRKGSIRYQNREWAIPDGTLAGYDDEVTLIRDPFGTTDALLVCWEHRGRLEKLGYAVPAPEIASSLEAGNQRRADKAVKQARWAAMEELKTQKAHPELRYGHAAMEDAKVIIFPRVLDAPKSQLAAVNSPEEPDDLADDPFPEFGREPELEGETIDEMFDNLRRNRL